MKRKGIHLARAAVIIWSGILLGIGIHAHFHPQAHTVYDIYADAARNWWAGRDMYVLGAERDYFRYSPLLAISLTPFAALPDTWGGPLWKVLTGAMYALALAFWARAALPRPLTRRELACLLLLALPNSFHSLYIGQANVLMLAALLFGLTAAESGRWNRAAGWLALATLVKGYPVALGMLLSGLHPRRFAPRYAAALLLGLLFPFLTQRPATVTSQYAGWLHHLQKSTEIMRSRLKSIDHLLEVSHYPITPASFLKLGIAAGAVVFLLCLWATWQTEDAGSRMTWVFQLFAVWVLLFGPATESCTYIVAAPVVAWGLVDAFARKNAWLSRGCLVASLFMMMSLSADLFGTTIRNFANDHGVQPVGAVVLLAYLLCRLAVLRRPAHAPTLASARLPAVVAERAMRPAPAG